MSTWPAPAVIDPEVEAWLLAERPEVLAVHPSLSPESQVALLRTSNAWARRLLAQNPALSLECFEAFFEFVEVHAYPALVEKDTLLVALASNESLPPRFQRALLSSSALTRFQLTDNPSLAPDVLDALLGTSDLVVHTSAIEHAPLCAEQELRFAEHARVQHLVASRRRLHPATLELLLEHALADVEPGELLRGDTRLLDDLSPHLDAAQSARVLSHLALKDVGLVASSHLSQESFARVLSGPDSAQSRLASSANLSAVQQMELLDAPGFLDDLVVNPDLLPEVQVELLARIKALPTTLPFRAGDVKTLTVDLLASASAPDLFVPLLEPSDEHFELYCRALLGNVRASADGRLSASALWQDRPVELLTRALEEGLDLEDIRALAPGFTGTGDELLEVCRDFAPSELS